jgi:multidrug efflux system membrane fusion protein
MHLQKLTWNYFLSLKKSSYMILQKLLKIAKKHGKISIILVALVVFILFFSAVKMKHNKKQQENIAVNKALVIQKNTLVYASAVGNVLPHTTVSVKSLVDGQIMKVGFKEGDFVKQGQVLFVIDERPFQVKLQDAKAALLRDQAQLIASEAALERNTKLVDKGIVAKQDFEQSKADRDSLAASIASDKAKIADAELQLSYCTITSPIDGQTGNLMVDEGNLVKSSDQNALVIINQIMPIDIKFSLPEKQLPAIQQQLKQGGVIVEAYLQQENSKNMQGKLSFIDNTVDMQSGTIMMKASFPNEDKYLWPGQFATVKLPIANLQNALLIPTRAIQIGENKTYVFVIKNKTAILTPIVLGEEVGDQTVVKSGLSAGDVVVTEGQMRLTDGAKVI